MVDAAWCHGLCLNRSLQLAEPCRCLLGVLPAIYGTRYAKAYMCLALPRVVTGLKATYTNNGMFQLAPMQHTGRTRRRRLKDAFLRS